MLQSLKTVQEVEQVAKNGHRMLQRIEDSKKPVVSAIMGPCLGGGLEVGNPSFGRVCCIA